MRLRFTPRAVQDLSDISDFIHDRSPQSALRVRASILETLQNLAAFLEMGRRQSIEGVRKVVTRSYAYLVYYSIEETAGEVVVLTIQHPAREQDVSDV